MIEATGLYFIYLLETVSQFQRSCACAVCLHMVQVSVQQVVGLYIRISIDSQNGLSQLHIACYTFQVPRPNHLRTNIVLTPHIYANTNTPRDQFFNFRVYAEPIRIPFTSRARCTLFPYTFDVRAVERVKRTTCGWRWCCFGVFLFYTYAHTHTQAWTHVRWLVDRVFRLPLQAQRQQ